MFVGMGKGLKYALGYDVELKQDYATRIRELIGMGVDSNHISNNVNISLYLLVVVLVGGLVLKIINRFKYDGNENGDSK